MANSVLDQVTYMKLYTQGQRDFNSVTLQGDFSNADFCGVSLRNVDLNQITSLKGAKFDTASLLYFLKNGYKNFAEANVDAVDFRDHQFYIVEGCQGSQFSGTDFTGVCFPPIATSRVVNNFWKDRWKLESVVFSNTNLTNADFRRSFLRQVTFHACELEGIKLPEFDPPWLFPVENDKGQKEVWSISALEYIYLSGSSLTQETYQTFYNAGQKSFNSVKFVGPFTNVSFADTNLGFADFSKASFRDLQPGPSPQGTEYLSNIQETDFSIFAAFPDTRRFSHMKLIGNPNDQKVYNLRDYSFENVSFDKAALNNLSVDGLKLDRKTVENLRKVGFKNFEGAILDKTLSSWPPEALKYLDGEGNDAQTCLNMLAAFAKPRPWFVEAATTGVSYQAQVKQFLDFYIPSKPDDLYFVDSVKHALERFIQKNTGGDLKQSSELSRIFRICESLPFGTFTKEVQPEAAVAPTTTLSSAP